jgi:hypothetical protein
MTTHASSKVKSLWKKSGLGLRLKTFVKELAASGDEGSQSAKDWFLNKSEVNQKDAKKAREVAKGPALELMRLASKAARSKASK